MSRRSIRLAASALFFVGGSVVFGSEVLAQEQTQSGPYASADELAARMDSLLPLVEESRAALEARAVRANEIDRVVSASLATVDTLHIGQLTVIAPTEQTDRAQAVFERVWSEHFEALGHSPGLSNTVFVFQWDDEKVPIYTDGSRMPLEYDSWVRPDAIEIDIRMAISSAMAFDLGASDSQIARWVGGNPLREIVMTGVYLRWVTTPSIVTRACLEGGVDSCLSAMGLGIGGQLGSSDEPWGPAARPVADYWQRFSIEQMRLWYTPVERQALIGSTGPLPSGFREAWDSCVDHDDFQACDRLLRDNFGNLVPAGGFARTSLLALAIELGGSGAWERVIEDRTMTPEQVLEYTAGMPIRGLAEHWQARLVEARPVMYGSIVPNGVLAILWSLLFVALAMRSTRWRLR